MNPKKVWLVAIIFGFLAAGMLYVIIKNYDVSKEKAPVVIEEPVVVEPEVQEVEEEPKNEMLPIPEGKRAMTIAVTDVQGVAGFIEPGAHVDVVAILAVPEEQKELQHDAATLLLQDVKVLAIGHAADDPETMKRYQMVTIEVTPVEGLTLSFATKYDLHLLLREEGDHAIEPDRTHVHEDDLHEGVFRPR
ncbi:Flp pilus assembly protein CpaB [Sporosarcina sp. ACRSL]|uniref:Flp pilus assembly protein CpaB n=1 Tax=Sporosarcina sp. ACRSL TaxID=2918215 RepID=UPI001EF4A5FD|nr:Flp pilus assembly protein CpaB [Sporosarcina sp. ACRSL]MCG7344138.1 Flp pilus assembly protein CpaB [Sporosarcina sp. ACRSL]